MLYHNFLLGLITAASIIFAIVVAFVTYMVTKYNERRKEYNNFGNILTKFCRLCYFVRYSDMFFSYEKRVEDGDATIVKESAGSFIYAIKFLAEKVEDCAIKENEKKYYPFESLDEYITWTNLIWYEFSHKNNRELNFRDYMPYPPAGMTKINYSKLITDLSFGHNIDPEYFYIECLGNIAGAVEVEVIERMKQLSDELNTGIGQKFKYLMKYSSILFISSVFVPLLCLLLPEMGIIYILQFILFLVFIIISCKIFLGLKDVINL
jgi:hypothetical protein